MMEFERKVGERGQVVIPKEIRDMLGIKAGARVTIYLKGNAIVLHPKSSLLERARRLKAIARRRKARLSLKEIEGILEELYERAVK